MQTDNSVFDFTDYRNFLKSYLQRTREKKKEFSLRLWARKLNLNGPSNLSMILTGSRHPGGDFTDRLIDYFRFSQQEEKYFKGLIKLAKATGDSEKTALLFKELKKLHPKKEFRLLDADVFDVMANWYYFAIRELVATKSFKEDHSWISKRLQGKVSVIEVKRALEKMLEFNILKRSGKNGKFMQTEEEITTSTDIVSEALKQFHYQMMTLAQESLRKIPLEMREITGVTLNVNPSKLEQAKKLIREFRMSFSKIIGEENSGEEVFQLNIQFFPLTELQKGGQK
jgi:uncharacterized protein (TIGR02147 family)